jgi:hypothetical protein
VNILAQDVALESPRSPDECLVSAELRCGDAEDVLWNVKVSVPRPTRQAMDTHIKLLQRALSSQSFISTGLRQSKPGAHLVSGIPNQIMAKARQFVQP